MTESLPPDAPDLSATQYVLEKLLGQGGFGQAYLALNRGLRRRCVLKVLTDTDNAGFVARFYREAQVMANLEHPTIPRVYEVATTKSGQPYFVMEYVDGKSLGEHLADEGGVLPVAEACRLIADAAEGLAAAHESGVVHRDVKLANLLVNKRGQMKVIDFGIAKKTIEDGDRTAGILTAVGQLFGTPRYMSPEQAMAKTLGPASDFYSLGVVLFIVLTGTSPFNGTPHEMMTGHVQRAPPKLSEAAERPFSPAIEALVARLLEKKPSARFDNGNELAIALRAAGGLNAVDSSSAPSWPAPIHDPAVVAHDATTPAPTERVAMRIEPSQAVASSPVARRTELQLGETVRRIMLSEPSIALPAIVAQPSFVALSSSAPPLSTGATMREMHTSYERANAGLDASSVRPRDGSGVYAETELALPAIVVPSSHGPTPARQPYGASIINQPTQRSGAPIPTTHPPTDFAKKDVTPSSLQRSIGLPVAPARTRWMIIAVIPFAAIILIAGGYWAWTRNHETTPRPEVQQPSAAATPKQPLSPETNEESAAVPLPSTSASSVVPLPSTSMTATAGPLATSPSASALEKKAPSKTMMSNALPNGSPNSAKSATSGKPTKEPLMPPSSALGQPKAPASSGAGGAIDDRL